MQMVSLDELVPDDDRYRLLEGWISWPAVRSTAAPFYTDFGRPGVDPVVLVKLLLVDAVEGIGSIRGTLRRARTDLSIRRFLGYGLTEQLPSHATLSYAQTRRFVTRRSSSSSSRRSSRSAVSSSSWTAVGC